MAYTKGEWRADKSGCVVSDAGMICDVGFMNVNPEANARLIAAAPNLLAACEAQEEADNWFGASDTGRKLKDKAKKLRIAAIAKAEA